MVPTEWKDSSYRVAGGSYRVEKWFQHQKLVPTEWQMVPTEWRNGSSIKRWFLQSGRWFLQGEEMIPTEWYEDGSY